MQLKCSAHKRRCLVTDTQIIHHGSDSPKICDGSTAKIGDRILGPGILRSNKEKSAQVIAD